MIDFKHAVEKFKNARIAVIGDIMLDHYTFGEVSRISPEAPIPIVQKRSETFVLGGAANVASNLASLGAHVTIAGIVGDDQHKELLFTLLNENRIGIEGIFVDRERPTTEKHRIVSGAHHQLLRLDVEETKHLDSETEDKFFSLLPPIVMQCDAIILSDYAKGVFSERLTPKIIGLAKRHNKLILADVKPNNKWYFLGVDLISPNLKEGQEMTGLRETEEVGERLVVDFGAHVVLTRGSDGLSVFRKEDASHFRVPGKKVKVFDVSGAGDTTIAVLTLGLVSGLDVSSAAVLANEAGAIVVQKPGTATLFSEELVSAFNLGHHVEGMGVVPKLWGYEKWIENNEKYCCKLLSLNKGYQCSLHYHKEKDETFVVTVGHVRLELGDKILHMRPGAFVRVPPHTPHRFTGMEDSLIMEMSTHHKEEDSYRIEGSRKIELSTLV